MVCVCYESRVILKNLHLFDGIALRLFVSARKDMSSPVSRFICNACGMHCLKWRNPNREKRDFNTVKYQWSTVKYCGVL